MRQRKQMKRKSKSWYIKFIPWHIEHFAKLQFLNDRIGVLPILPTCNFYIKLRLTQFLLALNIFSEVSTD